MWTSSDDESKNCNHTCSATCGYKPPKYSKGMRSTEHTYNVKGETIYRNDLKALIESCCPEDKRLLNHEIEYCIIQDAHRVLKDLPSIGCYQIRPMLNNKNQTAIHLAFYKKAHKMLNYSCGSILFQCFIDHINYVDRYGLSHLHVACITGDTNVVREFLDKGEDVNAQFHSDPENIRTNFTALHFAATNECRDVVDLLLQRGADVNAADSMGRTLLHLACGITETFNRWLSGTGQLTHLESISDIRIIDLLLKYGGDLYAKDKQGNTPLFYCFQKFNLAMTRVNNYEGKKITDLRMRQMKKIELLLKHGADVTVVNSENENILHMIVKDLRFFRLPVVYSNISFNDTSHAVLIELVLAANRELDVNAKNNCGEDPLHLAISLMSVDVVNVLLKYNADFSSMINNKKEPSQFIYPNIVPNLEAIRNVINIINLLSDRGYILTIEDSIFILNFMIDNCKNYKCTNVYDNRYNAQYIIWNALYYGSPAHLSFARQKLRDISKSYQKQMNFYVGYVKDKINKLEEDVSFYLDCKEQLGMFDNRQNIRKIPKNFEYKNPEIKALMKNLNCEIASMKTTHLKTGITLYDVMTGSYSTIYRHVKDNDIDKLMTNFPSYGRLIESHVAKALIRKYAEQTACQYLKLPSLMSLPDLCWKMIVSYLSNQEILNLSAAVFTSSDLS